MSTEAGDAEAAEPSKSEPDEETYRQHALDGADATLHDEMDHVVEKLRTVQSKLRDGENPTPEDLMSVQTALAHSSETIVAALDELTVGEEPEIVTELRDLGLKSNLQMLHAARKIRRGDQLSAGPYKFAMGDLTWSFAIMELLDEHGAVAEQGSSAGEIEDAAALSEIIDEVEAAEDVEIVRDGVAVKGNQNTGDTQ